MSRMDETRVNRAVLRLCSIGLGGVAWFLGRYFPPLGLVGEFVMAGAFLLLIGVLSYHPKVNTENENPSS